MKAELIIRHFNVVNEATEWGIKILKTLKESTTKDENLKGKFITSEFSSYFYII